MPYHRLEVYKKAYELALRVHRMSLRFPDFERCELGQQLRKSSKSIVANIAEGMGKQESRADVRRFIRMAIGSCDESRVWLDFAHDLGYISRSAKTDLDERFQEVGRMLMGIVKKYGK